MKGTNNIKNIMAVIAVFLTISIGAAVFAVARPANAPAVDENPDGSYTQNEEPQQTEQPAPTDDGTQPDENGENPTEMPQPTPTAKPTATPEQTATPAPTATPTVQPTPTPQKLPKSDRLRAMWISYLEFQSVDFSSKSAFVSQMDTMLANCADLGLNTVIVQVRPFGDALYKSSVYPTSHLINGTQGAELAFDPLAEMVTLAHNRGLRIEAWVNPYRAKLNAKNPSSFAANNPANNAEWVFNVDGGVYYNPCLEQVQDLVVRGIEEIVRGYDVDGIHLDDYFYPSTDMSLDASHYAASGSGLSQADWRRENVNTLIRKIYQKIKSIDSSVTFGISPQGNNDNNYNVQYSDVRLWLREEGYVDYIMPQLYWGFGYLTKSGRTDYQFANLVEQWAGYPRHSSVKLNIGLGAYRIGAGDGGANDQSEWSSGYNLMKQINTLTANGNVSGFALYRYDNLFKNTQYAELAKSEREHIKDILS